MFPPSQVFTDGDTKVLAAVDYFQCVSMSLVAGVDSLSPVGAYSYNSALRRVESHLPGLLPSL